MSLPFFRPIVGLMFPDSRADRTAVQFCRCTHGSKGRPWHHSFSGILNLASARRGALPYRLRQRLAIAVWTDARTTFAQTADRGQKTRRASTHRGGCAKRTFHVKTAMFPHANNDVFCGPGRDIAFGVDDTQITVRIQRIPACLFGWLFGLFRLARMLAGFCGNPPSRLWPHRCPGNPETGRFCSGGCSLPAARGACVSSPTHAMPRGCLVMPSRGGVCDISGGNCPLKCATCAAGRFAPPAPTSLSVGSGLAHAFSRPQQFRDWRRHT